MGGERKLSKRPQGVLCDISGVMKNSINGVDVAIDKSVEAFKRLQDSGVPYVLCTNESCYSTAVLAQKLRKIGFNISADKIVSPVSAIIQVIKENNHRPYVLVNEKVRGEFDRFDQSDPDIVVVGDAIDDFTYENMNKTFKLLVGGERKFYCLGRSKYYLDSGELKLEVGCFIAGLEYSSQVKAEVIGKPSPVFFNQAASLLGMSPRDLVMIGDDVDSDVGGAMRAGLQGILVKTGKYREKDASHPTVKPTLIADNLSHAIDVILNSKKGY